MAEVFFSVGTDTSPLQTGPWVTIVGNTATFAANQTGNIGVGDHIEYDNGAEHAYISGKTTQGTWSVTNATGGVPTAAFQDTPFTITRTFNGLHDAISSDGGPPGAQILLGTWDLVANTTSLNIACYADGVDISTGYILITSWTTSVAYGIKIYTPTDTLNECNQNQRHDGIENGAGYTLDFQGSMSNAFNIVSPNWTIDGLRITTTTATGFYWMFWLLYSSIPWTFSNCIVVPSMTTYYTLLFYHNYVSAPIKFFNNIFISPHTGAGASDRVNMGIYLYSSGSSSNTYTYNNSFYGNWSRPLYIYVSSWAPGTGTHYMKNNVVFNTWANAAAYDFHVSASATYFSNTMSSFANNRSHVDSTGTSWIGSSNGNLALSSTLATALTEAVFVDTTFGQRDLHLQDTSLLIDAGVGPATDTEVPTEDIDGDVRSGADCDVGPDEYFVLVGFTPLPPFTSTIGIFKSIFP
jgi:hypothetical protein